MPVSDPNLSSASLTIRLFGPFDARLGGVRMPSLRSRKGQWLLTLLVLRHGREVEREWLAGMLWPESDPAQVLPNLRRTLTDLRRVLGAEAARLTAPTSRTLRLDMEGAFVNLIAFDEYVARGDVSALKRAVSLYGGPLLEGCAEEWIIPEREAREQACLKALETLAQNAIDQSESRDAETYLRRVVVLDPFRESVQRSLMRALAVDGSYTAVTRVYQELRQRLRGEMNADPAPETVALFRQLQEEARRADALSPPPAVRKEAETFPGRLPRPLTSFIGREKELEAIQTRLASARWVTIVGMGGVGKTRLAIRAAEQVAAGFPHGVWFVDLAALTDSTFILQTVGRILGLREEPGRPLVSLLGDFLRPKNLLLILDNCEHLREACARLAEFLLRECPALRILATSRQTLGGTEEAVFPLSPLVVPEPRYLPPADEGLVHVLPQYEAARLFVERATAAMPAFVLTEANAPATLRIVRRLEGIPLAIELAAARVRMLTAEQVAAHLDNRFHLLTRGSPSAPTRQQTLRAALDWSYDLLTDPEQTLLRYLSVFAGGWTLEAAEAVASEKDEGGRSSGKDEGGRMKDESGSLHPSSFLLQPLEMLDLLTELADRSLVVADEDVCGERRYRMLDTVREYALERLEEAGEAATLRRRHGEWFLPLGVEAGDKLRGQELGVWMERLDTEGDNLRVALEWGRENAREVALQSATGLSRYWEFHGRFSEGVETLARALARAETAPDPLRANGLLCLGRLLWRQGAHQAALEPFEACRALFEECGDRLGVANARNMLGLVVKDLGDYAGARVHYETSLAEQEAVHNLEGVAIVLNNLGCLTMDMGEYAAAFDVLQRCRDAWRVVGNRLHEATAISNLGIVVDMRGDYETARQLYEESLAIRRALGDRAGEVQSLGNLAMVAWAQEDYAAARVYNREALAICEEINSRREWLIALRDLGLVAYTEGNYREAEAFFRESLDRSRGMDFKSAIASALLGLGDVARQKGDYHAARAAYAESLEITRKTGERQSLLSGVERMARTAAAAGDPTTAVRLFGAAATLRRASEAPLPPPERPEQEGLVAVAHDALGEEAFTSAWAAGCMLTLEQMTVEALDAARQPADK